MTLFETQVYCVAFSPAGKILASSSLDHSIRLWDAPAAAAAAIAAASIAAAAAAAVANDADPAAVPAVAASPVASAGDGSKTAATAPVCIAVLKGHRAAVWQVCRLRRKCGKGVDWQE